MVLPNPLDLLKRTFPFKPKKEKENAKQVAQIDDPWRSPPQGKSREEEKRSRNHNLKLPKELTSPENSGTWVTPAYSELEERGGLKGKTELIRIPTRRYKVPGYKSPARKVDTVEKEDEDGMQAANIEETPTHNPHIAAYPSILAPSSIPKRPCHPHSIPKRKASDLWDEFRREYPNATEFRTFQEWMKTRSMADLWGCSSGDDEDDGESIGEIIKARERNRIALAMQVERELEARLARRDIGLVDDSSSKLTENFELIDHNLAHDVSDRALVEPEEEKEEGEEETGEVMELENVSYTRFHTLGKNSKTRRVINSSRPLSLVLLRERKVKKQKEGEEVGEE